MKPRTGPKLLSQGLDPAVVRNVAKAADTVATANTFGSAADELLAKKKRESKAERPSDKIEWLLGLARPELGSRPTAQTTAPEALRVLRMVEARGRLETAKRLRATIGQVFRYAVATGRAEGDPTGALRGAVAKKAFWSIPASKMKMRRPHLAPLSSEALQIVCELRAMKANGQFLFPSARSVDRCISENTLHAALRRLGFRKDEMTAHGFRSAASSMLNESGLWNPDAIERQLAHVDTDSFLRAYARADFGNERVGIMAWWAGQCQVKLS